MHRASWTGVVLGAAVLALLGVQLAAVWVDLDRRAFHVRLPEECVVQLELAEGCFAQGRLEEAQGHLAWIAEHGGEAPADPRRAPPPVASAGVRARPASLRWRLAAELCSLNVPVRAVELCDADGDRRADVLVVADSGAWVSVAGSSGEYALHPVADGHPTAARCGDVLGTGRSAVLLLGGGDAELWVPDADLSYTRLPLPEADGWNDAVFADLDADGDLDVAAATPRGLVLLWNRGAEAPAMPFVAAPRDPGWPGGALRWVAVEDLGGDGVLDLLAGGAGQETVVLRRSGSALRAAPRAELPEPLAASRDVAPLLGDLDHDGLVDLLLAGPPARLLRGQGRSFAAPQALDLPASLSWVAAPSTRLLDLDRNGDLDLVGAGAEGVAAVLGSLLQETVVETLQRGSAAVFVPGDLDRDGDVDLVTAEGGTVEVWENLGGRAGGVLELTLEGRGGGQAQGALVEVRSGPLYQRRRCDGLAMTFGLGEAAAADRVRVTWTDGTVSYALQPPPDAPLVLRP